MATETASRKTKDTSALKRLGQGEQVQLLSQLLKAHPELQTEAEALAMKLITAVDPEAVAEDVTWAFQGFDQEEIWDRSGSDRFGGYTEPVEAADLICEERFEPFMEELERLLSMAQMEPALAHVKGLLLGLYRLKGEMPPDAEDFPSDSGARRVLDAWAKKAPARSDPSLLAWIEKELPDWTSHLEPLWRGLRNRARSPK
jgi:hypothetical protein